MEIRQIKTDHFAGIFGSNISKTFLLLGINSNLSSESCSATKIWKPFKPMIFEILDFLRNQFLLAKFKEHTKRRTGVY
jgi:hypothetical protein